MSESFLHGLISTNRFILKPLTISDVTDRYTRWLNDTSTNQFISAKLTQADLEKYVSERLNRENILFLGIFNKIDGLHIGNIKYEPIDSQKGYAVMGILIGEAFWRGKSVASEVILASAFWLNENKNIYQNSGFPPIFESGKKETIQREFSASNILPLSQIFNTSREAREIKLSRTQPIVFNIVDNEPIFKTNKKKSNKK